MSVGRGLATGAVVLGLATSTVGLVGCGGTGDDNQEELPDDRIDPQPEHEETDPAEGGEEQANQLSEDVVIGTVYVPTAEEAAASLTLDGIAAFQTTVGGKSH